MTLSETSQYHLHVKIALACLEPPKVKGAEDGHGTPWFSKAVSSIFTLITGWQPTSQNHPCCFVLAPLCHTVSLSVGLGKWYFLLHVLGKGHKNRAVKFLTSAQTGPKTVSWPKPFLIHVLSLSVSLSLPLSVSLCFPAPFSLFGYSHNNKRQRMHLDW